MAFKCENCGKGLAWGHNVSHSKRRTNRAFRPNIQIKRIKVGKRTVRMKLCANCIKLFKKREKALTESAAHQDTHSESLATA